MTTLLIGTTKGLFILRPEGAEWSVSGPHCDGWPINHAIAAPGGKTIWAAGGGEWQGAGVWRSDDGGGTWALSLLSNGKLDEWLNNDPAMAAQFGMKPNPPAPFTGKVEVLWSLGRAGDRLLAGGKPGILLESTDNGTTWAEVTGLTGHESREGWEAGGAGLVVHTIVSDPDDPRKTWVGISAAGVFATEDGGKTWDRRNRVSNAGAAAHHDHDHRHDHPEQEVGLCVHNMVRSGVGPGDLMYQQNHHGVFRSEDGGRSWTDISEGLPSRYGFPIAVHPRDPRTAWVIPLNGDQAGRFPPDASAAVWCTRDGGESWTRQDTGLPAKNCFFTVLRQAMAGDSAEPAGVYFGTNTGSVFATRDEGETWVEAARHLPLILGVETVPA